MHPLRWGLCTLANRDIADFGFTLSGAEGLTGALTLAQARAEVRDAAGTVITDPAHTITAGAIALRLAYLQGVTAEGCQQALDRLVAWLALGPALLWQRQRPTQVLLVSWTGESIVTPGKYFGRPVLLGTLGLTRESPYYRDRYESRVVAQGTGAAGWRVPVPTGTAPHYCTVTIVGASAATITQRAWDGSIVRQSTVSSAGADLLVLDAPRRKVFRGAAGVITEDPAALTLGHGFITAEPRWAQFERSRWQTLETSAGTMYVDYARHWLA